jgi:hypothetical protein
MKAGISAVSITGTATPPIAGRFIDKEKAARIQNPDRRKQ